MGQGAHVEPGHLNVLRRRPFFSLSLLSLSCRARQRAVRMYIVSILAGWLDVRTDE